MNDFLFYFHNDLSYLYPTGFNMLCIVNYGITISMRLYRILTIAKGSIEI